MQLWTYRRSQNRVLDHNTGGISWIYIYCLAPVLPVREEAIAIQRHARCIHNHHRASDLSISRVRNRIRLAECITNDAYIFHGRKEHAQTRRCIDNVSLYKNVVEVIYIPNTITRRA